MDSTSGNYIELFDKNMIQILVTKWLRTHRYTRQIVTSFQRTPNGWCDGKWIAIHDCPNPSKSNNEMKNLSLLLVLAAVWTVNFSYLTRAIHEIVH